MMGSSSSGNYLLLNYGFMCNLSNRGCSPWRPGIAQRFPKYKLVLSAIPAMAECIPEDLKKDLVARAQSQSFKIAFVSLKTWVK
jgi:hypothetical protein